MPKKYTLNDWRDEPITDRQQKLIEDKGYQVPDTKGEASDLITEILRKEDPATEGQIRRLKFYGICGDFSKKEAMDLIDQNKPLHDEEQYQLWKKVVCKIDNDIKPPQKTRGKGSSLLMGVLNGLVYSVRIVIGIFIAILAITTISKSLLGFAMFLISAFLAFPFLSKKFKGRFVAKGLIFAGCFFVGSICFVNAGISAKPVTVKENNQSQRSSL